jgi:hypothetical protein
MRVANSCGLSISVSWLGLLLRGESDPLALRRKQDQFGDGCCAMSPLQADGMSRANPAILMLRCSIDQYVGKAFLRFLRYYTHAIAVQHDPSIGEHALLRAKCS